MLTYLICQSVQNFFIDFRKTRTLLVALNLACLEISFVVKGAGAVILFFPLEYKTSVICHNVNTQNVKIARRDRPHILANLSFRHITLQKLNDDFYQYINTYSLYVADQDTARYSICSAQEKCVSLAEPYNTTDR